jgi:hypothetical protein
MRLNLKRPTNFSLSPELDKLKLVGTTFHFVVELTSQSLSDITPHFVAGTRQAKVCWPSHLTLRWNATSSAC